jgi:hypothetical protein
MIYIVSEFKQITAYSLHKQTISLITKKLLDVDRATMIKSYWILGDSLEEKFKHIKYYKEGGIVK